MAWGGGWGGGGTRCWRSTASTANGLPFGGIPTS